MSSSRSAFLSPFPKFFWTLPSSSSARPFTCSLALSVASPRSPRIFPFISLPVPLTWFSIPLSFRSFIWPPLCNQVLSFTSNNASGMPPINGCLLLAGIGLAKPLVRAEIPVPTPPPGLARTTSIGRANQYSPRSSSERPPPRKTHSTRVRGCLWGYRHQSLVRDSRVLQARARTRADADQRVRRSLTRRLVADNHRQHQVHHLHHEGRQQRRGRDSRVAGAHSSE